MATIRDFSMSNGVAYIELDNNVNLVVSLDTLTVLDAGGNITDTQGNVVSLTPAELTSVRNLLTSGVQTITVGTTAPSNPVLNQLWVDTN